MAGVRHSDGGAAGAWLAQVGHESGGFIYTRELWGPTPAQVRYEGRADLGNTQPGDGKRFMGRGLIQITGRANYRECGTALGIDLEANPVQLQGDALAARSAGWFWQKRNLNALADAGEFVLLTRRINGGTNGLPDAAHPEARRRPSRHARPHPRHGGPLRALRGDTMIHLSNVLREIAPGQLAFWCPGCKTSHTIQHGEGSGPRWGWNGNAERPTFTPSVLVRSGHHVQGYDGGGCWCDFNAELKANGEEPSGFNCEVCHTFVTDGQIQFLGDCTHALAGQTVPMVDFPEGSGC